MVMFFERMKKEIKRSLKVTIDTIKRPESLGARRRNRSSVQVYPSLPTTEEVTEEDSTNETLKWVNNNNDRTTRINTKEIIGTKPPDYEQSEKSRQNMIQSNPPVGPNQHLIQDAYQLAPPIYNKQHTGPLAVATDHHQIQTTGNAGVPSREETEEDKKERKRQQLIRRRRPSTSGTTASKAKSTGTLMM